VTAARIVPTCPSGSPSPRSSPEKVVSIKLSTTKFAYRQSRSSNCAAVPKTSYAQFHLGNQALYGCTYKGTSVEYSATEQLGAS